MENQENIEPINQFFSIRNLMDEIEAQLTACENLVTDLEYTIIDSNEETYNNQEDIEEDFQHIEDLLNLQQGNVETMRHNVYLLQRILHTPNIITNGVQRYDIDDVYTLLRGYMDNLHECNIQIERGFQRLQELGHLIENMNHTLEGQGRMIGSGDNNLPVATPVAVATAEPVNPRLIRWANSILNTILSSLTEQQRTSPHLRQFVEQMIPITLPGVEDTPHIIQLILNLLDQRILGRGRPKSQAYKVQSVLFDKKKFNPQQAMIWLQQNGYKVKKIDETAKMYRFRQLSPATLRKKDFSKFITKKLGNSGIELVIAYPISYA